MMRKTIHGGVDVEAFRVRIECISVALGPAVRIQMFGHGRHHLRVRRCVVRL